MKKDGSSFLMLGWVFLGLSILFGRFSRALGLICLCETVILFAVGLRLGTGKDRIETKKEPPALERIAPDSISVSASDEPSPDLLEQGEQAVEELYRLYDRIVDPEIRDMVQQLGKTIRKILDWVAKHPKKQAQAWQFMDYYLPTALKILNAYYQLESIDSPEVQMLEAQLEPMLEKLCDAFEHQLDTLLRDEAMDISTDITVMDHMLKREGFGGMTMGG